MGIPERFHQQDNNSDEDRCKRLIQLYRCHCWRLHYLCYRTKYRCICKSGCNSAPGSDRICGSDAHRLWRNYSNSNIYRRRCSSKLCNKSEAGRKQQLLFLWQDRCKWKLDNKLYTCRRIYHKGISSK